MIFEIYAKDTLVGRSALEQGDPPMGVAFGRIIPADGHRETQRECQTNHFDQSRLALSVKTPAGDLLPCAGVGITDCSNRTGELADIDVAVSGIPYPLYGVLFLSTLPPKRPSASAM